MAEAPSGEPDLDGVGDRELVRRWWSGRGRWIASDETSDFTDQEYDIEHELLSRCEDAARAARLLRLIVQMAPARSVLPMIGTSFVEDVQFDHGHSALRVVAATRLPIRSRELILSGLLPSFFERGSRETPNRARRVRRRGLFPWRRIRGSNRSVPSLWRDGPLRP